MVLTPPSPQIDEASALLVLSLLPLHCCAAVAFICMCPFCWTGFAGQPSLSGTRQRDVVAGRSKSINNFFVNRAPGAGGKSTHCEMHGLERGCDGQVLVGKRDVVQQQLNISGGGINQDGTCMAVWLLPAAQQLPARKMKQPAPKMRCQVLNILT